MITIGQKIRKIRGLRKMRGEDLGAAVGLTKSTISKIENDELKGGVDPQTLIRIAEALDDNSILLHYLETNPVYQAVLPKVFPDLNNIRRDPAVIFTRLAKEADEARESALILAEIFSNADPARVPNFQSIFKAKMEQIVDIKRAAEIVEFELMSSGIITKVWLDDVYSSQQDKCVSRGHHRPKGKEA